MSCFNNSNIRIQRLACFSIVLFLLTLQLAAIKKHSEAAQVVRPVNKVEEQVDVGRSGSSHSAFDSSNSDSIRSMATIVQGRPLSIRQIPQQQQQQLHKQHQHQPQLQHQNSVIDAARLFVEQSNTLSSSNEKRTITKSSIEGQNTAPANTHVKRLQVYPGLLDETLLNQGSFSFGAKTVKFDKLKVLGNIYVLKVNGKALRDTYLLKSSIDERESEEGRVSKRAGGNEEIRMQIIG